MLSPKLKIIVLKELIKDRERERERERESTWQGP
jgi:hypothetical protein